MPRVRIDNKTVDVPEGTTILQAARQAGIDIPALCWLAGWQACTSCFVCVVRVDGQERLLPSCATAVGDGMVVESESDEVRSARRTALELLLSDHLGDCLAPCQVTCPAGMNIPRMIRRIAAGDLAGAIETVKADIALPAVLGRICPAPCERACRRAGHDAALAICLLKRYAADVDLASPRPYRPEKKPDSGKGVAIVGAGPAGLAAAYYLLQQGHACTLFDQHDAPGGALRYALSEDRLPRAVLEAEIARVAELGARFRLSTRVGREPSLGQLRGDFSAVVIATGPAGAGQGDELQLPVGEHGLHVERRTHQTPIEGVFAGGGAVRASNLAVRAVADGKGIACAVNQYLSAQPVTGPGRPFTVHIGRLHDGEMKLFLASASPRGRVAPTGPAGGLAAAEATAEARRCLHCDCRSADHCKLRRYADAYAANATMLRDHRRSFEQLEHPQVLYEPGKCIDCGLCVQITEQAQEPLGLTFIGRGFQVRVGVPLGRSLSEAFQQTAARCAEACPTGAIVLKDAPPEE